MIEGLTERDEKMLDILYRFERYGWARCYASKAYARREAGISRYWVEKLEAAQWEAMVSHPEAIMPNDPNDQPF